MKSGGKTHQCSLLSTWQGCRQNQRLKSLNSSFRESKTCQWEIWYKWRLLRDNRLISTIEFRVFEIGKYHLMAIQCCSDIQGWPFKNDEAMSFISCCWCLMSTHHESLPKHIHVMTRETKLLHFVGARSQDINPCHHIVVNKNEAPNPEAHTSF